MKRDDVKSYRVLLRRMPNRKWQVWIGVFPWRSPAFTVAVVKHAGKLHVDRERIGLKPGPKLPFNTLPTANFDTKDEADGVAFGVGKYMLGLGDMKYAWLDEEEG